MESAKINPGTQIFNLAPGFEHAQAEHKLYVTELLPAGSLGWALITAKGFVRYWSPDFQRVKKQKAHCPNESLMPIIGIGHAVATQQDAQHS